MDDSELRNRIHDLYRSPDSVTVEKLGAASDRGTVYGLLREEIEQMDDAISAIESVRANISELDSEGHTEYLTMQTEIDLIEDKKKLAAEVEELREKREILRENLTLLKENL